MKKALLLILIVGYSIPMFAQNDKGNNEMSEDQLNCFQKYE